MIKQAFILAGAALLASAGPAFAKPDHAKHGKKGQHARGFHDGRIYHAPGLGACPPGLAKKGCMPPGQAKKLFEVGQRLPYGYGGYTPYNQIPYDLRRRYDLDDDYRYIYRDDYLYRVDPRTYVVTEILRSIL